MKFPSALILTFASIAWASPVPEESNAPSKRATNAFAVGTKINIEGSTKYFVGANSNWTSYLANDGDIDVTFAHLKDSGVKVFRVWGFRDVGYLTQGIYFQSLPKWNPVTINTGANGLQRLDAVVAAAEKYGIKLIVPFVNWWDESKTVLPTGVDAYANYYVTLKNGWYTDDRTQTQYRKYVATVVNRYKASTAVLAWELINEPRCTGCPTSIITQWATSTSAYVKSLDPTHLVALGDEGFINAGGAYAYSTAEGIDFEANLRIPSIDIGTFHLSSKLQLGSSLAAQQEWIKAHAAISTRVGKPTIFEAYLDASSISVRKAWQDAAFALKEEGLAGDLIWQWGEKLPVAGSTPDDANTVFYGTAAWKTLVKDHADKANA